MNRSNLKAFTTALANAALSRKTALQYEVAVTFAVHLDSKEAKRLSRAVMCEIFAEVGYKCSEPTDIDWKSVNRRITAAFELYKFMTHDDPQAVAKWTEGKSRMEIVNAIVTKLEPLKLNSTNQILEICGKVGRQARRERGPRAEPEGTRHVTTRNLDIVIPPSATRADLIEASLSLMRMAEQMANESLAEQGFRLNEDGHVEAIVEDEQKEALAA
jgi:hypothetical protein